VQPEEPPMTEEERLQKREKQGELVHVQTSTGVVDKK
jgi:hypothetical protein